jgi:crotonobetainyl-CoA:carnitine CoA-transferase CaiB-like acyl-CoA transferase
MIKTKLNEQPLAGIRVLDFTANAAGPACSMLLADFGAEVIKIEPPEGDATRRWGKARLGERNDLTPTFVSMNRNKQSVVLDLKDPRGLKEAHGRIAESDVVIESYAPGVAARLGISYKDASIIKPDVIYCSVSGFGQTGPLSSRPGFDMLMQAFAGHMSITGERGRGSVRSGPSAIDLMTGAHGAFAILVALRHRDKTGEGQAIDVSLYDSAVYMICNHLSEFLTSGQLPDKFGSDFPLIAPYGVFKAKDREFYLGVSSDRMWQSWCKEMARPDLAKDLRFIDMGSRVANREVLLAEMTETSKTRTASEWVDAAIALGIPASLVQTMEEVACHEHTLARELVIDSGAAGIKTVGIPIKMSKTPGIHRLAPPSLGGETKGDTA